MSLILTNTGMQSFRDFLGTPTNTFLTLIFQDFTEIVSLYPFIFNLCAIRSFSRIFKVLCRFHFFYIAYA